MVYEWEEHQETCYRLYIEERRSLEEIMEHMRLHHKFSPSKRAYQTQFRRWGFPPKQNPAYKNAALVARVRELWERNLPQREILRVLTEEDGFNISPRELMRVRTRYRWLLRVPNGNGAKVTSGSSTPAREGRNGDLASGATLCTPGMTSPEAEGDDEEEDAEEELEGGGQGEDAAGLLMLTNGMILDPEIAAERRERMRRLEEESAEKWETKKRRRRTKGWSGLPADPPGPPRFPSETTLEESKAMLNLGGDLYRRLRLRFQQICEEAGVTKKTLAGPDRWEAAKARLVAESAHLQSIMSALGGDMADIDTDKRKLSLDIICTDVTKRMRTLEKRLTMPEAKNILGLNPAESREVRLAFYKILRQDHFTSRLAAGPAHWEELKGRWMGECTLLRRKMAARQGDTEQHKQERMRAFETLARDVLKRLRDDQTLRGPGEGSTLDGATQVQQGNLQPLGDDMEGLGVMDDALSRLDASAYGAMAEVGPAGSLMPGTADPRAQMGGIPVGLQAESQPMLDPRTGLPLDPQLESSLLMAAAAVAAESASAGFVESQYVPQFAPGPPPSQPQAGPVFHNQHHHHHPSHQAQAQQQQQLAPIPVALAAPVAVWLRLHPSSTFPADAPIWIATLDSPSLDELRHVAANKYRGAAVCTAVEGVVKAGDGGGGEVPIQIAGDQELTAYLAHSHGVGEAPAFFVQLRHAWEL